MSDDEIVLRLDRTTAGYLLGALHDLGEHLAAGVSMGPMTAHENDRLGTLIRELRRSLKQDESDAMGEPQESAATNRAERDGGNDDEDEILARAIGDISASRGARWAARRLKTVAHEEEIIVDLPAIAVAAKVHAGLTAMKYPLLPGQLTTIDDQYKVRWVDGGGIGKLDPVLITVRVVNEAYGTAIRIRGAAKEGIIDQRSAQKRVDPLTGILCDLFDKWEIIDVMD
jgi:hypothetical protein